MSMFFLSPKFNSEKVVLEVKEDIIKRDILLPFLLK